MLNVHANIPMPHLRSGGMRRLRPFVSATSPKAMRICRPARGRQQGRAIVVVTRAAMFDNLSRSMEKVCMGF